MDLAHQLVGHLHVLFLGVVRGGRPHLRLHGALEIRDFLRPLVDQQAIELDGGLAVDHGVADVF
jgi:hypothetical protein